MGDGIMPLQSLLVSNHNALTLISQYNLPIRNTVLPVSQWELVGISIIDFDAFHLPVFEDKTMNPTVYGQTNS